ncbi:MAG: DUF1272 domain-containing protein [Geminicoccaceae bacterium]
MLALRPNCEACDRDLPPAATDAMICSYECTFCRECVETRLANVCPNCGGGFVPRPIPPARSWRPTTGLDRHPPSDQRVHMKHRSEDLKDFIQEIKGISPEAR